MLFHDAELKVNRVLSGMFIANVKNIKLYLKPYELIYKLKASEYFQAQLNEALNSDFLSDSDYEQFLLDHEIWEPEDEYKLTKLQEDIEELKVRMYSVVFNDNETRAIRKILELAKADVLRLNEQKHSYYCVSARCYAESEKNKFLIAMSLFYENGKRFSKERNYCKIPSYILESVATQYRNSRLNEHETRWLVRNEPWKSE